MISRHPFDRLVSAFRDKLERFRTTGDGDPNAATYYYNEYGRKIVEKFREEALLRFGKEYFQGENHFGAPVKPLDFRNTSDLPIFWEFVQMVIEQKGSF